MSACVDTAYDQALFFDRYCQQQRFDMPSGVTDVIVSVCHVQKMAHGNSAERTLEQLPGGERIYQYYQKNTQQDLESIVKTLRMLDISCWYHGAMSSKEAKEKLRTSPSGTFLIRDSQDPRHLFSLSVKTHRGTTSVRIQYTRDGRFRLDADESIRDRTPVFDCVVQLMAHYMEGEESSTSGRQLFWLEPSGRKDVPVKLNCPLKANVPMLQHLCRLSINRSLKRDLAIKYRVCDLPLPPSLKSYLIEYPFRQ
ncbi:suppressor of cytokine signaling 2-like [Glandiceps talaboti]